jgi:peptidoglycan hydrolase CwlO-like protein
MVTTVSIILWVSTIIGYIVFNLFNKNRKLELIISKQNDFIKNILSLADNIDKTAQKIDSTMWVSADPELKIMFDDIKNMQDNIKKFTSIL